MLNRRRCLTDLPLPAEHRRLIPSRRRPLCPVGEPVHQRVQHGDPSIAYQRHVGARNSGRLRRQSIAEGQLAFNYGVPAEPPAVTGSDVALVRDGRIAVLYTLINGLTDRN